VTRAPRDHLPDHKKFGYATVMEQRAIRERLLAAGAPEFGIEFAVSREYTEAHKNDPTYRERVEAWSARCLADQAARFDAGSLERPVDFTKAELDFLADHFAGANDPVAQAVLAKIRTALEG
jgi:hypothetical protein